LRERIRNAKILGFGKMKYFALLKGNFKFLVIISER
jgi:hypothetical protein